MSNIKEHVEKLFSIIDTLKFWRKEEYIDYILELIGEYSISQYNSLNRVQLEKYSEEELRSLLLKLYIFVDLEDEIGNLRELLENSICDKVEDLKLDELINVYNLVVKEE